VQLVRGVQRARCLEGPTGNHRSRDRGSHNPHTSELRLSLIVSPKINLYPYPAVVISNSHHVSHKRPHKPCNPTIMHRRLLSDSSRHPHSICIQRSRRSAAGAQEKRINLFDAFCGDDSWYDSSPTPLRRLPRLCALASEPTPFSAGMRAWWLGGVYGIFLNA
jgi:hypothetical protein